MTDQLSSSSLVPRRWQQAGGWWLAPAGTLGGYSIVVAAVLALAVLGRQQGPEGVGGVLALALIVVFPLAVVCPPAGCWLALRAGGRPQAGVTALLLVPAESIVAQVTVPLVEPLLGDVLRGHPSLGLLLALAAPPLAASALVARAAASVSWSTQAR